MPLTSWVQSSFPLTDRPAKVASQAVGAEIWGPTQVPRPAPGAGERQVLFPQMVLPVIEYKTLFTARKPIGANHLVVLFRSAHLKGDRGLASSPGSRNWLAVASFSRLFMRLLPIPHSDPLSIMEIVTSGRVFEGRSIRRVNTLG
ncbi:uncharacterized protein CIMG_01080 [Coccidioides immitis RS]|uniref:Uncharacterized protein n=1 Tax=Coccidioides immitis (strain RS) TaxID=246410 RepID=J3KID8_COCIM|nr:uncharacterized protein CIMG_01080 [Coccidioides immitis RS]EAS35726.3 hypothetical protein CIMG_01080 [Coccidioides immitis RS]